MNTIQLKFYVEEYDGNERVNHDQRALALLARLQVLHDAELRAIARFFFLSPAILEKFPK